MEKLLNDHRERHMTLIRGYTSVRDSDDRYFIILDFCIRSMIMLKDNCICNPNKILDTSERGKDVIFDTLDIMYELTVHA